MKIYHGTTLCDGTGYGKLYLYYKTDYSMERRSINEAEKEIERLMSAVDTAYKQLIGLADQVEKEQGRMIGQIFVGQSMLLQDSELIKPVIEKIKNEKVNAEHAVRETADHWLVQLSLIKDDYLRERSEDIREVTNRLMKILSGRIDQRPEHNGPCILLAEHLTAGELMTIELKNIQGIILKVGSVNSHLAILIRSKGIPCLILEEIFNEIFDKQYDVTAVKLPDAILDGDNGQLILSPKEEIKKEGTGIEFNQERQEQSGKRKEAPDIPGGEEPIEIHANVSSLEEAKQAEEYHAAGIGLFRTEYLYLAGKDYPSEEEQYGVYREVVRLFGEKRVCLRTLDIGADKKAEYFRLKEEVNPALGCRGIRVCLERKDIFKTQLRAMLRSARFGNLSILIPMIVSLKEIRWVKSVLEEVREELTKEGISYGRAALGVMIETPAAALIGDVLASEVDFFSIGTNDLIQYTLACDRENEAMDGIYDSHHPGVLRLIAMTARHAHEKGIRVGICGELAWDPALMEEFIKIGIDELSVPPGKIPFMKEKLQEIIQTKA